MNDYLNKLFIIDKHKGPSSFEVVEAFRKVSRIRRVGHTGTLDPLAEGLLLLCTGKATRASEYFMNLDKTYEFDIQLGVETSTLDAEGEIVREEPCPDVSPEEIGAAAASFVGVYRLKPPAYSALKKNGRRLYQMARAGETPEVEEREVSIYAFQVMDINLPIVRLRLRCSRGTYVRSLAKDFGEKFGLPSHVKRLTRTRIGNFSLDDAYPSRKLFNRDIDGLAGMELARALDFLPGIVLKEGAKEALFSGMLPGENDVVKTVGDVSSSAALRMLDGNGDLIAVGKQLDAKRKRLFWVDSYRIFTGGGE
jgi:tRNA pseudouridine55 synthase